MFVLNITKPQLCSINLTFQFFQIFDFLFQKPQFSRNYLEMFSFSVNLPLIVILTPEFKEAICRFSLLGIGRWKNYLFLILFWFVIN